MRRRSMMPRAAGSPESTRLMDGNSLNTSRDPVRASSHSGRVPVTQHGPEGLALAGAAAAR
jgi:hypothetical protein